MKEEYLTLHDKEGNLIAKAKRSLNRLYKVLMDIVHTECFQVSTKTEYSVWHARLGHIGGTTMKSMVKNQLVRGIPKLNVESEICTACLLGKQTRNSFPAATSFRATKKLELVHGDLCGPITHSTPGMKRYVFVLIDDYTRYMWTILLKEKSEDVSYGQRRRVHIT